MFCGERMCSVCARTLPFQRGAICPFCGRKVGEAGACLECKEKPLKTQKARSVFVHEGEAVRFVLRFKRGEKYLAYTGASLMLPLAREEFAHADLLAFVPMTKKAAEKVKNTAAQKTLGRREREENLKGSFRITNCENVKGKSVLIVDDTMTTGSTSSELAAVFLKAGAKRADLLTLTSVPLGIFKQKRKRAQP